jgi:hypothetical protein
MEQYAYLIAGVGLGVVALVAVYVYQRHRARTEAGHSWLSYLLLWPLILDVDKSKRNGQILTRREWLGWGLVLLIIFVVIVVKVLQRSS